MSDERVRMSIPGRACKWCNAIIGESVVCPGCKWVDPPTVTPTPQDSEPTPAVEVVGISACEASRMIRETPTQAAFMLRNVSMRVEQQAREIELLKVESAQQGAMALHKHGRWIESQAQLNDAKDVIREIAIYKGSRAGALATTYLEGQNE